MSAINNEDMPLTFLTVYDAPHELPDEALTLRLSKYCKVISSRSGKYSKSHPYNGLRHFRMRINEPLPSYLRFGKFLVRLTHDGQQHTCRRCNCAGHFANECKNVVCFNCEELGHESRDCESAPRCCICKSTEHLARRCSLSWFLSSRPPAPDVNPVVVPDAPNLDSDGHVAASADDPPSFPVRDPSSDSNAAAPASDLSHPPLLIDFLRTTSQHLTDSDILQAAEASSRSSVQPSDGSSTSCAVNSQGFIWEQVADHLHRQRVVPNPPGPQITQSSQDVHSMSPELFQSSTDDQPADLSSGNLSGDVPSGDVPPGDAPPGETPSDVSPQPEKPPPVRSSASSSVAPSRRKPAPLPPALQALSRRPTRPSLHVPGKSTSRDPPPPSDGGETSEAKEMDTHSTLKHKQEAKSKKGPKKH